MAVFKVTNASDGMAGVTTLLDVSANTTGDAFEPSGISRSFQIVITGTAVATLEATIDGVNWFTLRVSTASESYSTAEPWPRIRVVSSGMSAATVKAYIAT